jgi:DNA-binding XRE family transcriptional regulator
MKLNLKAARYQAGMTQEEAGKVLGVGQFTISKWETGEIRVLLEMRPVIAKAYGLEVDQIDWQIATE